MDIRELSVEDYKGYELLFEYETDHYYDVVWNESEVFHVNVVRKPFGKTLVKRFEGTLFADHLENPRVFGVCQDNKVVGFLELGDETWHQRLRISELWVDPTYRGQGFGSALIDHAQILAKNEKYREIVLETQSCNDKAITLYLKKGFRIKGIDLTHYTNEDIKNKEVRLELMMTVKTV